MFNRKRSFICDTKCHKKFNWQAEEGSESDLPDDIMVLILARLPGSSLSRFRFVCKKWLALITKHHHKVPGLHINNGKMSYIGNSIGEAANMYFNIFAVISVPWYQGHVSGWAATPATPKRDFLRGGNPRLIILQRGNPRFLVDRN